MNSHILVQFDANPSFLTNINVAFLTIVPAKIPVTTVIGYTNIINE